MSTLNERIVKCRKLANLTQTDMAEKLNIKCSTYSQMERKGIISAERLFDMAEIFDVSPCYLFGEEESCRKKAETPLIPQNETTLTFMRQPEAPAIKRDVFVVTKKEESIIKLLRNFSRTDYDRVIDFIQQINRNENK